MKIAFDAQPLLDREKTGVGWNTTVIIDEIIKTKEAEIQLNVFDFRNHKRNSEILESYKQKGCKIKRCRVMPAGLYQRLCGYIPVPYCWLFGKNADFTQFFNYTLSPGTGTPASTFIHDMAYKVHPETVEKKGVRWLSRNMAAYCQRADFIVTVSEFSKSEIVKYMGVDPDKIIVVYGVINFDECRPDYTVKEIEIAKGHYGIDADYILYLGTLEPRKNIPVLVEAYHLLRQKMPDAPKLVLAGKKGWMYEEIFSKVKEYRLEKDVIFTGYVDQKDAQPLMAGASVFVFPSLYEGFGTPPVQAMACGTPVIVSDAASLPEVVGDAGMVVPVNNAEALSETIKEVLTDRDKQNTMREKGLKMVKRYTPEAAARKLLDQYRNYARTEV